MAATAGNFTKVDGHWVANVTGVEGEFTLHLEKNFDSAVVISIATGNATKFAPAFTFQGPAFVIDEGFKVGVGTKKIRIECIKKGGDTAPTYTITE